MNKADFCFIFPLMLFNPPQYLPNLCNILFKLLKRFSLFLFESIFHSFSIPTISFFSRGGIVSSGKMVRVYQCFPCINHCLYPPLVLGFLINSWENKQKSINHRWNSSSRKPIQCLWIGSGGGREDIFYIVTARRR